MFYTEDIPQQPLQGWIWNHCVL